jgi:hypothetical protein
MESELIPKDTSTTVTDSTVVSYQFQIMPKYVGFYQLGGKFGLRISQEKKPSWFKRKMMKWCLGFEWFDGPAV